MARHVSPNVAGTLIVRATIQFVLAILAEAGLGHPGLGAQLPAASRGRMLNVVQTLRYLAPQLAIYPGLATVLPVLGPNLRGDGLDPRLTGKVRRGGPAIKCAVTEITDPRNSWHDLAGGQPVNSRALPGSSVSHTRREVPPPRGCVVATGVDGWRIYLPIPILKDMDDQTNPTVAELRAALDESEAQIDAGEVLPLADVLAELQTDLDRWRLDHSPEPRRGLRM